MTDTPGGLFEPPRKVGPHVAKWRALFPIEHEGQMFESFQDIADYVGTSLPQVYHRAQRPMTTPDAHPLTGILRPIARTKPIIVEARGEIRTLADWAREIGASYQTMWRRYVVQGLRGEALLEDVPVPEPEPIPPSENAGKLAGWGF